MSGTNDDKSGRNKLISEISPYAGLGLQLAITVSGLALLGVWLDKKFDLSPILTISLSFFGAFAGMYNFIKSVLKKDDKDK